MKTLLLLILTGVSIAAERFQNVAADSPLPQGDGFAAKLTGDAGAGGHPAVIFADNTDSAMGTRCRIVQLLFPALRSGHRLFPLPSLPKQIPSST